ncbi:MAG TPA: carbohydrate ABC transporter permease [Aeriscardovia aeriphila]|uniref:Carbohydrate ABC transporter permease n=1 Tax=Aeriscardovia aeriphila TaxID=218139 RepID=A0A921KBI0_9BIFI|nr:carbohydrate ABC transporter permease [Aeriscardovia aeriphila]
MNITQRRRLHNGILAVVILLLALICAIPLWVILINSFKTPSDMTMDPFGLPRSWSLSNYQQAFESLPIGQAFLNTIIVTVLSVVVEVLVGAMAAYGMIMKKSRFTAAVGAFLMLSFVIPGQTLIIPQYKMLANTGLVDNLLSLVVIYSAGACFCYYLIVGYMRGLPQSLFEAAKLDGAGPWRIFFQIVLPLIRPILITSIVFQTMGAWNDFMTANIYLQSVDKQTIIVQVFAAQGRFNTNWPLFMAVTTVALIPVFVFFLISQKWIVSGLVAGSVKG